MQIKSIAECSKRAFCNTFDLHYAILSGRLNIGFAVVTQLRKSEYDFFYVFDTLWKRLMESLLVNSAVFVYHTENPETRYFFFCE